MINSEHLCMSCMREIGEAKQCPHCGYVVGTPQISPYLNVRSVIGNRYLIGRLLEYNGDGATYIAWDIQEKRAVTIREFLPDKLCDRAHGSSIINVEPGSEVAYNDCKADFLELWRKLIRMSGLSALVSVYGVIEENNTAYAICEYIESISLRDYLLRIKTGYIPWERAKSLFMPMLSTLGMLHTAGIIHRGISPTTLQIGRDGKMRLGGFSIWQARTARSDLTPQLFPGYAAIEQYGFEGQQGPWTDLYSFAATLYRALIGTDPIEATERLTNDRLMVPGKFAEQLPAYVINGLINALQILPEDRTRSVEQLRAELSASPTATVSGADYSNEINRTNATRPAPPRRPSDRRQQTRRDKEKEENRALALKAALISAIVLLLGFLFVVLIGPNIFHPKETESQTTQILTTGVEMVKVGKFVGKSYSEIANGPYWQNNFSFQVNRVFSDKKKDIIIAQDIEEGKSVNKGATIVLTVSDGLEQIKLSNVIGLDYDEAKTKLTEAGFHVLKKTETNYGSHTAGTVKSVENADAVSMKIGNSYDIGTTVVLNVWGVEQTTEATSAETTTKKEVVSTKPNVVVDDETSTKKGTETTTDKETTTKKGSTEKETTTKKGSTEKETTTKKGSTEKETTAREEYTTKSQTTKKASN